MKSRNEMKIRYPICQESMKISRLLEKQIPLQIVFRRWSSLKRKLFKNSYLSKKVCETHYGVQSRVDEIQNREDLASLIFYYSDRWHPARVRTFDGAFRKVIKLENEMW